MSDSSQLNLRGVLQAGGKGTRLYPATEDIPKPLLQVGGVPMLERLLRQFLATGIRDITIITGWLADKIEAHISSLRDLPSDLSLRYIREPRQLGNIGALSLLPQKPNPILFAFGDLITDLDFSRLIALHLATGGEITLASHYEQHRLTLGELSVKGDLVVDYKEKPTKEFLICSGIAVFQPSVPSLIDDSRPTGISDLILSAIARSMKVTHWTHGAFWMDINTPELKEAAEREVSLRGAQMEISR